MNVRFVLCALAAFALATPAGAQRGQPAPSAAPSSGAPPRPAFENDLAGLAHVLGGAHYIRILCSGKGDQTWRQQAKAFMDLEGPPDTPRRKMMAAEFNEGYREQEQRYSGCSPDAQNAENDLKKQGGRYAQALSVRYKK